MGFLIVIFFRLQSDKLAKRFEKDFRHLYICFISHLFLQSGNSNSAPTKEFRILFHIIQVLLF